MQQSISFVVQGKVFGKQRPKFSTVGGYARAYTPQKTVDYENQIKAAFLRKYPNFKPLETPLLLTIRAVFCKAKSNKMDKPMLKPDVDNIIKCIDALNGIAFIDDKQIVAVTALKTWGDIACLEIKIEEAE
jgi:Holliday junction resolvase RusA-like endonuclease